MIITEDKSSGYNLLSTLIYNINSTPIIIPSMQGNSGIEKILSILSDKGLQERFDKIVIIKDILINKNEINIKI